MSEYRVALEAYNGPLDLLLFLIKREEVDIHDIPIARITGEYVGYVNLLREVDPEAVGDFLVLAATLMEIKSRMLLPKPPPEEVEEDLDDPRMELVRQLLEYKKYKDAATVLEEQADDHARRFPRRPVLPPRDPDDIELDNLELWDLFDAFNRMLEQTGRRSAVHEVEIDDTPVALHADDIVDALERDGGETTFEALFKGRSRGEMIGLFLALLELVRRRRVGAIQKFARSEIYVRLRDPDEATDVVAAPGEDVEPLEVAGPMEEAGPMEIVGTESVDEIDRPVEDMPADPSVVDTRIVAEAAAPADTIIDPDRDPRTPATGGLPQNAHDEKGAIDKPLPADHAGVVVDTHQNGVAGESAESTAEEELRTGGDGDTNSDRTPRDVDATDIDTGVDRESE